MAVVVCHFTTEWGMYTFQIQIPDYMAEILQFDIATVSIQKLNTEMQNGYLVMKWVLAQSRHFVTEHLFCFYLICVISVH